VPDPVEFAIRDAVPVGVAALRQVYRRASLSNARRAAPRRR